jgi:hypothetical protein
MKWGLFALAAALLLLSCQVKDTTMPGVSVIRPATYDTIPSGNYEIRAVATDESGVDKVEFIIDASLRGTVTVATGDTYRYIWDNTGEAVGSFHTLKAKAWDKAGNSNTSTVYATIAGADTGGSHHFGNIDTATTWSAALNPHYVDADVFVDHGATLTIQPGCEIRFAPDTRLYCGFLGPGQIVARGKADSLIVFTSAAASPASGDWRGVAFYPLSTSGCALDYCVIDYAGRPDSSAVLIDAPAVDIANCRVLRSAGYGVDCTAIGALTGFSGNTLTSCHRPLRIFCGSVGNIGAGNSFVGNDPGQDVVEVAGGSLSSSAFWASLGVPYLLNSSLIVGGAAHPVLTLGPGTTVKCLSGVSIKVGYPNPGGLVADGTAGRITFTSGVNPPAPGDWGGIAFYPSSLDPDCRLRNCQIDFGGGSDSGNVIIVDALPDIRADSIGWSRSWGIFLGGLTNPFRDTLLATNWFYGNARGGVGP